MARPIKPRRISFNPNVTYFKPQGPPPQPLPGPELKGLVPLNLGIVLFFLILIKDATFPILSIYP